MQIINLEKTSWKLTEYEYRPYAQITASASQAAGGNSCSDLSVL